MNKNYIIKKPHVTEKTADLLKNRGVYCFEVHPKANKVEIKKVIEETFGVTVLSVNVVKQRPGTRTRQGRVIGRTSGCKKAYIHLAPGDNLPFFEGA